MPLLGRLPRTPSSWPRRRARQPRRASAPEIGWHEVELTPEAAGDPLLGALPARFSAFQWHSYEAPLPPGATALARSPVCLQAFRLGGPAWGIQFHAEVSAEDADYWISDYRSDPDAVRIGLDPEALRAETQAAIGAWNDVGRATVRAVRRRRRYSGVM